MLQRSEIQGALSDLLQKSVDEGKDGWSPSGIDIGLEATKFEGSGKISGPMYQEVASYVAAQRAAAVQH